MSIKAIDNISTTHNTGKISANKRQNDSDCEQVTVVMSKDAANALRNIAIGLMVLGASAGAGTCLTGCSKADPEYLNKEYIITNTGDTIPANTVQNGYYDFINNAY